MRLIQCIYEQHADAILAMLNHAIVHSTALYDYEPRPPESMVDWFKNKQQGNYPVIGAVDDAGFLLGFASYGGFRAWPAYQYSIEHSVYVHHEHHGQGVGSALLRELIRVAKASRYHTMIAGIDVDNLASIALHQKLGFEHAGTIRHAGFKFNRWLDLSFYQLLLG
ncbi:MAG: GNAT family N-acetyltransferase [Formosimonas sp.]